MKVMIPSLDKIQQAIIHLVHLVLEVSRGVACWKQDCRSDDVGKSGSGRLRNFFQSVSENKNVCKPVGLLMSGVNLLGKQPGDVLSQFRAFKVIWDQDRDDQVKEFISSNPDLYLIKEQILHYETVEQEIADITPIVVLGGMELSTAPLKMSLSVEAKAWKLMLCKYVQKEYKKKLMDMIAFISEQQKKLSRPIADLDDVRFAMEALSNIRDSEIIMDMTMGPIEEAYSILNKFEVEVTKEEAEGVDTLRYSFAKLQSKERAVQHELVSAQPKLKENLLESVGTFQNDLMTFGQKYETVSNQLIPEGHTDTFVSDPSPSNCKGAGI
ncbi:dynein axonemal heavy chain 8-like [Trichomycterus rosablanca]|uniref:dynein axonemal heavy chain 8-like n=1 Tax=Trichomycterus rosablanca TaxID=2290929 RepID=UPI002F35D5F4